MKNFCFRSCVIFYSRLKQLRFTPNSQTLNFEKINVPFSIDEVSQLLNSDLFSQDYRGILEKTIITVLYYTGIRRQELIDLKTFAVDLDSKFIKVKGKQERLIPLLPEMISSLEFI